MHTLFYHEEETLGCTWGHKASECCFYSQWSSSETSNHGSVLHYPSLSQARDVPLWLLRKWGAFSTQCRSRQLGLCMELLLISLRTRKSAQHNGSQCADEFEYVLLSYAPLDQAPLLYKGSICCKQGFRMGSEPTLASHSAPSEWEESQSGGNKSIISGRRRVELIKKQKGWKFLLSTFTKS